MCIIHTQKRYFSKDIYCLILILACLYLNYRLLHDIFHIGPGITPRLPYHPWYHPATSISAQNCHPQTSISALVSSWDFNISPGIIPRLPYQLERWYGRGQFTILPIKTVFYHCKMFDNVDYFENCKYHDLARKKM